MTKTIAAFLLVIIDFTYNCAHADTTSNLLQGYRTEARRNDSTFKDFSIEGGKRLYEGLNLVSNQDKTCSSCHGSDPRREGKTRAGKIIAPMAPAFNKDRFTDEKKVEKWFVRNCDDVLHRNCSAREKGDFIIYLQSIK